MRSSKEFFEELRHGDEYMSCFMSKEVYSGIDLEIRDRIGVAEEVRQYNETFKSDETHKNLKKEIYKAKKKLIDYEYERNHKKK